MTRSTPTSSSASSCSTTSSAVPTIQASSASAEELGRVAVLVGGHAHDASRLLEQLIAVARDDARRHQGEGEARGVTARALAGLDDPLTSRAAGLEGGDRRVVLVREAHGRVERARLGGAADDERRPRLLNRFRQGSAVAELVVASGEVERVLGPLAVDDLQLLGEELDPRGAVEEREAVRGVLELVPAGAETQLDAAARDVVDGDHRARRAPTGGGTWPARPWSRAGCARYGRRARRASSRRPATRARGRRTPTCSGPSETAPRGRPPHTPWPVRATAPSSRPPGPRSSDRRARRSLLSKHALRYREHPATRPARGA